jgi:hypothetical protein
MDVVVKCALILEFQFGYKEVYLEFEITSLIVKAVLKGTGIHT